MTTELLVKQTRSIFTKDSTISSVEIDKKHVCFFLEDRDRGLMDQMTEEEVAKIKVKKETCIGYGEYNIDITISGRFEIWLPVLTPVKGFSGIRQHIGNDEFDTEGCQLPGMTHSMDKVSNSTDAFYKLLETYLIHLTLDSIVAKRLVLIHRKGKAGTAEFTKLFNEKRVKGQTIKIQIVR